MTTLGAIAQATLVIKGYGLIELAITLVITTVIGACVYRYVIAKNLLGVSIRLNRATGSMARELLKYGSRNSVISICGAIAFYSDTLIIGLLLPVSNITYYAVANKLVKVVQMVASKPIDALPPSYAHYHVLQDTKRQFRLFTESVSLALALRYPL
jgi:O-antigen/teichoic acid export membrane protein